MAWFLVLILVIRNSNDRFYAAKILTLEATKEHANGRMLEKEIMRILQRNGETEHLPYMVDTFDIDAEHDKKHICFVLRLLGSDVASLRRSAHQKALPVYTVKVIIKQVLEALSHLHKLGIVHTGMQVLICEASAEAQCPQM